MFFQIISIAILLAFYSCYFIKMIIQNKKGIQTNQIGKGKEGLTKFIEITMKAAAILVIIAEFISIIMNTSYLHVSIRVLGTVIGIVGLIVFIISVLTMHDSWRVGVTQNDETELITNGIYQISRNPAFLGFDLVYIGILYMFFNWFLFLISIFAIIMLHLQIVNVEEPFFYLINSEMHI